MLALNGPAVPPTAEMTAFAFSSDKDKILSLFYIYI